MHGPEEADPAPAPPRVWSALVVGVGAILAATLAGVVALFTVLIASGRIAEIMESPEGLATFLSEPLNVFVIFVPGQAVLLLSALLAARCSRQPVGPRVGYVAGRIRWRFVPLFMLAVPLFALAGNQLMLLAFGEPGGQLQLIAGAIGGQTGVMAVIMVAFIALVPALVEETLFRGYVQRRLLERWPPAAAIACSSLLFALAHLDLHHATFAIVPGIWFGIVAWRCGSTWPAMLCHATLNLFGSLGMMFGEEGDANPWSDPIFLAIMALFAAGFLASLAVMWHAAAKRGGTR